jgi:hypothetical protein
LLVKKYKVATAVLVCDANCQDLVWFCRCTALRVNYPFFNYYYYFFTDYATVVVVVGSYCYTDYYFTPKKSNIWVCKIGKGKKERKELNIIIIIIIIHKLSPPPSSSSSSSSRSPPHFPEWNVIVSFLFWIVSECVCECVCLSVGVCVSDS